MTAANNRNSFFCAMLLCMAFLHGCSEAPVTGSETTGGVEIAVVETTIYGTTTPGATALLFDTGYSGIFPGTHADTAVADDTGGILFSDLPEGTYNLFVYAGDQRSFCAMIPAIRIIQINHKTVYTDSQDFSASRTITGRVTTLGQPIPFSQVYIPGSPFITNTDSTGSFILGNIPEGVYTVIVNPMYSNGGEDTTTVDFTSTDDLTIDLSIDLKQ
ncbi:MAG: carboxypeptidase-like regulatory domain-containing protein [Chitinispirillaceae bacterium]|nr:carboxypeptidase-like regulatory domain-containing protein [Chitinispirillaceae bacterium]